jgi:phosphate transport system permease protein
MSGRAKAAVFGKNVGRIGPFIYAAFAASALLFISASIAILVLNDIGYLVPAWQFLLVASAVLIGVNAFISYRRDGIGTSDSIRLLSVLFDMLFVSIVAFVSINGIVGPDFVINPGGIGASFEYKIVLPFLVMAAGVLTAKATIYALYGYGSRGWQAMVFTLIRFSSVVALLILGGILFAIVYKGAGALSIEFLMQPHRRLGQAGGIWTCIEGTFWLVMGAMLVSAPLGIGAAVYLQEYSRSIRLKRVISIAVSCLNGVPSVVFGLFGLAFLVSTVGISLLAGSVILGFMNLPTIILTTQEALKVVPNSLREGSVALGATRWQTIRKVVLPAAMPGILTGLIIGVAKAAGETAPIMWTAVTFTATNVKKIYWAIPDPYQPVNNLCYHLLQLIYFLGAWDVEQNAWGTALVLLILVLGINMAAIIVRNYYRKKMSW